MAKIKMQTQDDINVEKKKADVTRRIAELQSYLTSVDWYASRKVMTGKDVPTEVVEKSDAAREEISRLREEQNKLEGEQK